jgi:hypothetical protein
MMVQLNCFALQGVPLDMRQHIWPELAGARQRRQKLPPHYYPDAALKGANSPFAHQIDLVSSPCASLQQHVVRLKAAQSCC